MSTAPQSLSPQEQNKHLVVRWFEEVWNQGRRETIFELFAPAAVLHDGSRDIRGPEEFCAFHDELRSQFTDFHISPIVSLAEGDLACVHWSAEFLHTPTARRVRITGTSVVRVADNQFVEAWQNWDAASLAALLAM
ncbi:MAG TPA: nuclear transport factor 2 family protein [Terriglobales bacterium]|nr:nuclear transport factor 2 family protein [Terriglobales bacterium]